MKTLFITGVAIAAITFSVCKGSSTSSKENSATGDAAAPNHSLPLQKLKATVNLKI